jgi:hypothetical protein
MSDASNAARSLRERLSESTEDRLGRAFSDLLENPLLTGAIGRAFDAREKAVQAQELAMGALNLPSAADIERLTRRLRSVSNRLEGIEDGVDRLEGTIAATPARRLEPELDRRLSAIEHELKRLGAQLERFAGRAQGASPPKPAARPKAQAKPRAKAKPRAAKPAGRAFGGSKRP